MPVIQRARNFPLLLVIFLTLIGGTVLLVALYFFNNTSLHVQVPQPNITRQEAQGEKIVLLFWSNLWGRPARRAEGFLKKGVGEGQCPVACEVTADRSRAKDVHAFVVHARDPRPLPPSKNVPWILTSLENPVYTPVLTKPEYMSQFHLLRSYRLNSDFPTYGGCLHNKDGLIRRYKSDFKGLKSKLQRTYKFSITFFNQDCDYFVDDQILHALNAGSVPVVMSTDKIYEFLPGNLKNSIVNVRDFKSPQELAERLKFLMNNETEYNKYLEH